MNAAISVRRATAADAETLIDLINGLCAALDDPPTRITPDDIRRDGFGAAPWFTAFIAERGGGPVGYALVNRAYSTDHDGPGLYVSDLFVDDAAKQSGAGRALMRAAAEYCRELGGRWLYWDVWVENAPAYAFYEALGAEHRRDLSIMLLDESAMTKLLES